MLGPQLQTPGGSASSHALAGSGRRHLMAPQPTTVSASLQPGPGQVSVLGTPPAISLSWMGQNEAGVADVVPGRHPLKRIVCNKAEQLSHPGKAHGGSLGQPLGWQRKPCCWQSTCGDTHSPQRASWSLIYAGHAGGCPAPEPASARRSARGEPGPGPARAWYAPGDQRLPLHSTGPCLILMAALLSSPFHHLSRTQVQY